MNRQYRCRFAMALLVSATYLPLGACSSLYYSTLEKLGYPKRELMVSRVTKAQESQKEAKEQFRSALERFHAVLGQPGGKLQDKYDVLDRELQRSEAKAAEVKERVAAVEDVSEALFSEWKREIKQYQNTALRDQSRAKLEETQRRYTQMIEAMKRAVSKLDPALQPLRDDVLFLKHNLNAQAIASLGAELTRVQSNVDTLIRDLESSISEADRFIAEMSDGEN